MVENCYYQTNDLILERALKTKEICIELNLEGHEFKVQGIADVSFNLFKADDKWELEISKYNSEIITDVYNLDENDITYLRSNTQQTIKGTLGMSE